MHEDFEITIANTETAAMVCVSSLRMI